MTQWIKLLSCDPALANWGLAKMEFNPDSGEIEVIDLKLVTTEAENAKTVRKSSDDLRRVTEAYLAAKEWALWADLIAAEVPTGSKSARAAKGSGTAIGLLAALSDVRPLIQTDPIQVKKCVTGRKTASKDEMIQWAYARWPDATWKRFRDKPDGRLLDANEHLADACAIGVTAVQTPEFRQAIRMLQALRPGVTSKI